VRVEIGLAGDKQVSRELLRFGERALAAKPAFEAIGELLLTLEKEQFKTEGKSESGGWDELRASTLASKKGPAILDETGELKLSLTERDSDHQIWETTDDFLLFGTDLDYASYLQTGTGDFRGKDRRGNAEGTGMVRRRPLALTELHRAEAVKILQRFITTGLV
jgi:phage gpG-like protein